MVLGGLAVAKAKKTRETETGSPLCQLESVEVSSPQWCLGAFPLPRPRKPEKLRLAVHCANWSPLKCHHLNGALGPCRCQGQENQRN